MANDNEDKRVEKAKKIASKSQNSTYDNLEYNFLKAFRWLSSLIDRVFFSSKYLWLVALLLACMSYVATNYTDTSTTLTNSKVLSNMQVSARYNSGTFELSGLPSACEIVLTGDAANVANAAGKKGYCQVDLEGMVEGNHTVKLKAIGFGDNVSTIVSPSEVTLVLKKKTTMQFDLSYDFINQNSLDNRYILSEPVFATSGKINIRASQDTLNSVALVKALIDVSGQTSDFTIQAPLVAYDKKGNKVNAELVPDTIEANVKISSPSNDVPIRLNPIGQNPLGVAIDSAEIVDHQTVRIYAPENVLRDINELLVDFDMSTVTDNIDKEMMLPISMPSGVNASDILVVNVKVSLSSIEKKTIKDVTLNVKDNYNNLAIAKIDYSSVDVELSGSQNNIDNVSIDDIDVYFQMPQEPGTYTLPLVVQLKDSPFVTAVSSQSSVTIEVVEGN